MRTVNLQKDLREFIELLSVNKRIVGRPEDLADIALLSED